MKRKQSILSKVSKLALAFGLALAASAVQAQENWPQAAGPSGNWSETTKSAPPTQWSVARNENIVWRTVLPETGQSGIAVWGSRLFLTIMEPLSPDPKTREGHDIVGYCLNSRTGKVLWTVSIPGTENSAYAYGFSDSTSPTPVTDGQAVWFCNSSGAIVCCDLKGKTLWRHEWKPTTGRPFNKQFEPILYKETLLNMEPRDPNDPRNRRDPWNYLRGLDKKTGKTLWVSEDALTHYNTPVFGLLPDKTPAILQGRGGYHDAPEMPTGLSLTSLAPGTAGKSLWKFEAQGKALYTQHWTNQYAFWFDQDAQQHLVIDIKTGKLLRSQSLVKGVDYRYYDAAKKKYVLQALTDLDKTSPPTLVFPAWFCNVVTGGYHYFLCFTDPASHFGPSYCVGRINIDTGKAEYLELPVQVIRDPGEPDKMIWNQPQPSDTTNARGIDAAGDPRSKRDGWYWDFLGSPTVLNGKIYITTMLGVTYVVDGAAKILDENALLAVNDLGIAGRTWSLNSLSYANGKIYHRSMKEVVCIGAK